MQHRERKYDRVRERFLDGWLDQLKVASDNGIHECILAKARPYLVERIVTFIDSEGSATISRPSDNEAYIPGEDSGKGCQGGRVKHKGGKSQTFCEWYDMVKALYRETCGKDGIDHEDCPLETPPITPLYVSEELFKFFVREDLTQSSFRAHAARVANEVYNGVYDYWSTRLDSTEGNTEDSAQIKAMLRWFIGRQFHVKGDRVDTSEPNNANIYSCFSASGLFAPRYSDFVSSFNEFLGPKYGFPY
ncbi:hypothetical protein G6O69_07070 [Pseudenhygromyxa sp. WMMC2535]|uniref:hypothetical protein n=1 Tax=Pseudenhygromyxa sp. WMMC2535 TaxID=2712867 RepID=UPI0015954415|nr:hypothetical protein [Pseudenhygromyxa sp. WMMC2535]NVB37588.1 hypothetical protein [Pseudenhygromyxa sp. WMMC2535]